MRSMFAAVCALCLIACGDDAEPTNDKPDAGDDKPAAGRGAPADLREVECIDQSIQALVLHEKPAAGRIREEGAGMDWFVSYIDATGGGLNPTESFVYARFTEKGLEKVDIGDEDAFESLAWEIAFRRYVIRVNSGVSGPGEVQVGRTAPMTQFANLKQVPDNLQLRTEQYFIEDGCEFVPDGSGIEMSPAAALSSFWTYQSCVQMTKNVYVVSLPKERQVKLEVLSYYSPDNQKRCDETGTVPMGNSGAGNLRIRWDFID